jgi:hypothetical protein
LGTRKEKDNECISSELLIIKQCVNRWNELSGLMLLYFTWRKLENEKIMETTRGGTKKETNKSIKNDTPAPTKVLSNEEMDKNVYLRRLKIKKQEEKPMHTVKIDASEQVPPIKEDKTPDKLKEKAEDIKVQTVVSNYFKPRNQERASFKNLKYLPKEVINNLRINIPGILDIEEAVDKSGNLCISDGGYEEWIKINWDTKCLTEVKAIINQLEYTAVRWVTNDKRSGQKLYDPKYSTDDDILRIMIDENKIRRQHAKEARKPWENAEVEKRKLERMIAVETNKDFRKFESKNTETHVEQKQKVEKQQTVIRTVTRPIIIERKVGNEMMKLEEITKREADQILDECKQANSNLQIKGNKLKT